MTTEPHQIIVSEKYIIKLFDLNNETSFNQFQKKYFESEIEPNIVGIQVFDENDVEISSCIVNSNGGSTTVHETSNLLSYDGIVICCGNSIIKLSIPDLEYQWKTISDSMTCFEIFYLEKDYLIHGELEITRLDKNGKIVWQNSGKDIFTTREGENDFYITEDEIIVKDWNYEKYVFDYNGHLKSLTKMEKPLIKLEKRNWWEFWK